MSHLIQDMRRVEKAATLYAAICVILLMVCTSLTIQNLLVRLAPGLHLSYLPWLGALVSAEALISQGRLRRTRDLDTNVNTYRLVEVLLVVTVTRLASLPWLSISDLGQTLAGWEADFLTNFFDAQFLLSLMAVIIIWGLSVLYAQDLLDFEGDELALDAGSLEGLVVDRAAAQQRLTGRVFTVGGVMVFINGILRQEIVPLLGPESYPRQDAWHVVIYFVVGLVLLSISQLANRRLAWAWERIPVRAEIARRWMGASVIFLCIIALLSLALPTGYTIGFLPALSYLAGTIFYFLFALILLILTPILYVISWLMGLFHIATADQPIDMTINRPEFLTPETLTPAGQPAWLELLRSVLFWFALLGVVGSAMFIYFRQNKELVTKISRIRGLRWLVKVWQWLIGQLKTGASRAPGLVSTGLRRLRFAIRPREKGAPARYLSLRRLNPRQKIMFYYSALLRRASEAEQPRAGWQTPHEYEGYLSVHWSEVKGDLASLTETFSEARYSQHEVTQGQIRSVRQAWDRVRKYLRERKKNRIG